MADVQVGWRAPKIEARALGIAARGSGMRRGPWLRVVLRIAAGLPSSFRLSVKRKKSAPDTRELAPDYMVNVRVSEQERRAIQEAAEADNVTQTEWLRRASRKAAGLR